MSGDDAKQKVADGRAVAVAVLAGFALFFILPVTTGVVLGDETPYHLQVLVAGYGLAGGVLGFMWPRKSWRLGLWLFAVWPPMLLFAAFMAADVPLNFPAMLRDLLGYSLATVAACFAAEVGAIIRRREAAGS